MHKKSFFFVVFERIEGTGKSYQINKLISDRFTDSTYAYQVIGNNIDKKINLINQKYILQNLKPNLTIILKANFNTIHARIKKRKNNNKFDKLKTNFYKKAQNAYLSLAKKNKNYLVFDSSKNTPDLEKEIFSNVFNRIKQTNA